MSASSGAGDGAAGSGGAGGTDVASGQGGAGGGITPSGCVAAEPGVWTNVSPAGVSLEPMVNGGANFGFHHVTVHPTIPSTVFVGADRQGLWRSQDCGTTWTKRNTGEGSVDIDRGSPWAFAIDPVEPDTMYIASGEGANGLFKSVDGGVDWVQLFPEGNVTEAINLYGSAPDIYSVAIDPTDHEHLLCGFRQRWLARDGSDDWVEAGVIESLDGGASWRIVDGIAGMGEGHTVFFLGDRDTWLVVPEHGTIHRTTNAGETWEEVSTSAARPGGSQLYRAVDGTFYVSAAYAILRSTDGGATWQNVSPNAGLSTQGLVGDGARIYATDGASHSGQPYGGPIAPFWSAPEVPGDEAWSLVNEQLFDNGGNRLDVDRTHHFVYASAWHAGVLRLLTE